MEEGGHRHFCKETGHVIRKQNKNEVLQRQQNIINVLPAARIVKQKTIGEEKAFLSVFKMKAQIHTDRDKAVAIQQNLQIPS